MKKNIPTKHPLKSPFNVLKQKLKSLRRLGRLGVGFFTATDCIGTIGMEWTLTPRHEVLTVRQAAKALRDTKMTVERLPLLKYSDAAIQQLIKQGNDVKLGDIIRITRHSLTSNEVYYYRRVVV